MSEDTGLRIDPNVLLVEMERNIRELRRWRKKTSSAIGVLMCILTFPMVIITCLVFFVLPFDGRQNYVRDSFVLFHAMFVFLVLATALTFYATLTWLVAAEH